MASKELHPYHKFGLRVGSGLRSAFRTAKPVLAYAANRMGRLGKKLSQERHDLGADRGSFGSGGGETVFGEPALSPAQKKAKADALKFLLR